MIICYDKIFKINLDQNDQIRRRSIVARMLNRLAWTPQVLEAVVGWVASTVGTVVVEVVVEVVVVAGAQLLSCVPRVLARIHSLLAVTLQPITSSVLGPMSPPTWHTPPGRRGARSPAPS